MTIPFEKGNAELDAPFIRDDVVYFPPYAAETSEGAPPALSRWWESTSTTRISWQPPQSSARSLLKLLYACVWV